MGFNPCKVTNSAKCFFSHRLHANSQIGSVEFDFLIGILGIIPCLFRWRVMQIKFIFFVSMKLIIYWMHRMETLIFSDPFEIFLIYIDPNEKYDIQRMLKIFK